MNIYEAILLGAIQGVAEFLPISSSGHLTIAEHCLSLEESPLTLNLALHLATLVVIILSFHKKILSILFPLNKNYLVALIITSIPTAIIGFMIKSFEKQIFGHMSFSAFFLCLNGCFLLYLARLATDDKGEQPSSPSFKQAFLIGLAQGVAALPGISRSGSTIGTARILGLPPLLAAEYSLIASIPVIFGAALLEAKDITEVSNPGNLIIGTLVAGLTGWFSVKILLKIVKTGAYRFWGLYCLLIGLGFLIFIYV